MSFYPLPVDRGGGLGVVEGAGLAYLDQPYVADAVRRRAGRGEATRSAHQTRGT